MASTVSGAALSSPPTCSAAEALGRDFVVKYLQPQSITSAAALPIGFTLTEPMPRVFGSVTVTESGGDTALMLGVLGNAGAELLPGEANGFGVDFMEAINFNVAVRTSSVTAAYRLDFITNTGSDPKMVYDQAGVLGYSPHNMMAWSEQLDMYPSQGGAAHCLVTPDVDTWPGGGPTADRMTAGATTELYKYRSSSVAGTVIGQTYTLSRLVKRDTWDFVWMQFPGGGDLTIFNLATGTFTLPLSGAPVTPTVDNLGGGWWRLKVTAVATVTTSGTSVGLCASAIDATFAASTGVESVIVGPVQFNRGSKPCAYVPTAAAARSLMPQGYDPVTHAPLGVLCEPAATNSALWSSDFTNAVWMNFGGVVTPAAAVAPNGLMQAVKLAGDGAAGITIVQDTPSVNGRASIYAKAGELSQISIFSMASPSCDGFDLATGTIFQTLDGGVAAYPLSGTARMEDVGSGWWRCSTAAAPWGDYAVTAFKEGGDWSSIPAVGHGAYFWGPQLEAKTDLYLSTPTSYIPTTSVAATRAGDIYSVTAASIGNSTVAGTWWVETYLISGANSPRVIGSPGSGTAIHHEGESFATYPPILRTSPPNMHGAIHKVVAAFQAGDIAITADGLVPSVTGGDASFLLNANPITFGSGGGTWMHGWLRKAVYRPRRISDDEMQRETGYTGLLGGAAMLAAETQGVGIDFTHPTENAVAVKTP